MKIIADPILLKKERRPVILAAGFFDGLHLGHQRVINLTVAEARRLGGAAWVLTFDKHPLKVLKPDSAPLLLTSNRHKLKLFRKMRVNGSILMPFNRKLSGLSPGAFIKRLSSSVPGLAGIFVGENWRFGHRETGDVAMLTALAGKFSIKVTAVRPVLKGRKIISSTRIRGEIVRGNLKAAAEMLGRPISVLGAVVKGRATGRTLGFPTANLETSNEVLPPLGVYAVNIELGRRVLRGVANIGVRPTFACKGNKEAVIEVYLLDFKGNLYGREIEVFFMKKLRNERRFRSAEELRRQIEKDVKKAKKSCCMQGCK